MGPVPTEVTRAPGGERRRTVWSHEQLTGDPVELLGPMAEAVRVMAGQQRYEEAAVVRDEAERLRALLERHRQVVSLRLAGRVVLDVEGEGEVVLDGGLWVEGGSEGAGRPDLGATKAKAGAWTGTTTGSTLSGQSWLVARGARRQGPDTRGRVTGGDRPRRPAGSRG